MRKRLFLSFALLFALALGATLPARAGPLLYGNWWLSFAGLDPRDGGIGTVIPVPDASFPDWPSFQVKVAGIGDGTAPVLNWLSPLAGSGVDFTPVDFYEFWSDTYYTSIGKGAINPAIGGLDFMGVLLEVTLASRVPEPQGLALLCAGLLGAGWVRRRR